MCMTTIIIIDIFAFWHAYRYWCACVKQSACWSLTFCRFSNIFSSLSSHRYLYPYGLKYWRSDKCMRNIEKGGKSSSATNRSNLISLCHIYENDASKCAPLHSLQFFYWIFSNYLIPTNKGINVLENSNLKNFICFIKHIW